MGTLESGRSFDPRYSSSFQRGGEPVTPARAESRPPSDPWALAGLDEIAAELDSDGSAQDQPPQVSESTDPAEVNPEAIRFVRNWGIGLAVGSLAALAIVGFIQQSINFATAFNGGIDWLWSLQQFVYGAGPWSFVFGLGCIVFAGYKARNRKARA
ncbi:hypothetical protein [Herbiconiux sp. L3-i23]|uniref:hypothetical protein n=1 Tax=Herbiconiux sp. L3-i23 TaxID=2905871 RepID=UPI00206D6C0C|nr:hypothetical protein [Herbiconiux sp. L3-i23]BDI23784.1 hypothetical protein L3i23_25600 [Herbiconiux sp. L3-i23]